MLNYLEVLPGAASNWYLRRRAWRCILGRHRDGDPVPLTVAPTWGQVWGSSHRCNFAATRPAHLQRDSLDRRDEVHVLLAVTGRIGQLVAGERHPAPRCRRSSTGTGSSPCASRRRAAGAASASRARGACRARPGTRRARRGCRRRPRRSCRTSCRRTGQPSGSTARPSTAAGALTPPSIPQSRSMMVALAMPPPSHIVCRP